MTLSILHLGLAAILCQLPTTDGPARPVDGKITWIHSYAAGKKLAAQNGKPLFVVFRCER